MSPNASKWDAKQLTSYSCWTAAQSWDQSIDQRTAPRYLVAGQSYYVEILQKEAGGEDHAAVAWSMQGVDSTNAQNWATSAMGALASASSNYSNSYPPSNALDGETTSFFHTNNDANAWWLVDFRQDRLISSVELVNRQDYCQNRLSNFRVTVEDASGLIVASQDFYPTSGAVAAAETWTLPQTVAGRRVKIQFLGLNRDNNYYLHLAEVKALGPDVTLKNWAHESAVEATQSVAYSASFPAAYAIDGNANTFHHTTNETGSWLQVDLGSDRLVDSVELFNRLDSCQNRLSNFRISVLDAVDAVLISQDFHNASGEVQGALRWELPQAVTGRRVKVELLGLNREGNYYLHIAEINVWGRSDSTVTGRGLRGLVSADVMSSYVPALTDDRDDDSIPNDLELANGLNPDDATDALADFDHDGINNLTEIHAGSNPQQWDSVPGVLVDEIWHHILGDHLTASGYKAAITRYPDEIHTLTTSQAFAHGEQYVRRVCGYLTAPVTGDYQFWGAADSDVDLFLSTSASKFDRQLILDNKVLSWGGNYDFDLSQKSRLVTLAAGQKYYFEMWHKEGIGGSYFSVAWKTPTGSRILIPTQYLSSYGGDANDQDDDDLKDDYELANGLSITDDGKSPNSTDGAYGDLDGDGLSNLSEMKAGTSANAIDSDNDGVSDYDELNFFNSATLANNIGAFTSVATFNGDAYTVSFGEWEKADGIARQYCRRGSVTYPVTVPMSGVHAVKFVINSRFDGNKNELHEFDIKLNGKRIAYKTINILPDSASTLALLTPWLTAGQTYNLELFVDNSYNTRRISIDQVQILAAGGNDSNNNGTPDWVDIRLNSNNGFDSTSILSKTSPATLEGDVEHFAFLSASGGTPKKAPNGRFFTDVPLTSGAVKTLNFAFENGAVNQTATIQWLPTNLLQESAITLRQGDSLLLTAFQNAENASLESYTVTANGQTYTKSADQTTAVAFTTPGTSNIQLTHTGIDAIPTTRSITVTVLSKIAITPPLCITGYSRLWTHPSLPAGAQLHFDERVTRWQESTLDTYTLQMSTPENQPVLIRQGATGPILGSCEVKSASVRSGSKTGVSTIDSVPDYQVLEMPVVIYGDLTSAEIRCEIIIGGVTYLDGSTTKTLRLADFDNYGTSKLVFKKLPTAHSNCHRFSIWHDGTRVAYCN